MRQDSLKFKVGLYLALALSPAVILIPYLIVQHQEEHLHDVMTVQATRVAEVVVRSTRHAMMSNRRELASRIVEDIGQQEGIDVIRIVDKDGIIVHSSKPSELARSIGQKDEPCVNCHRNGKPPSQLAADQRWRIYRNPDGERILGAMEVIRNEPTCSSASCHQHPAGQSVLGIVDIGYSLGPLDRTLGRHAWVIGGIALTVILLVAAAAGWLLHRLVYVPLRDLEAGAARMAAGSLAEPIPVRSADEFGRVAGAFNQMRETLQRSMGELQDLVATLEKRVEARTQELRLAEAEVAQGEKLAAVGLLASGVAHELNNPLTGVLTFTSLLRKKMPEGSLDAEDLDLVIRETKRCASIIRRLLDFAREKVPVKGFFQLNALIEETARFIDRPAALQDIEVALRLDPDLPQIWGDADLIKQVLLNILVNAEQAISGHGTIRIESRVILDPPAKAGGPRVPMIEVAVSDSGCGIPEQNLQRVFDPFFTSKEVGKGTGLGLSVSYGIVRAHGGRIMVESIVGSGSTFRVCLPITEPDASAVQNEGKGAAT